MGIDAIAVIKVPYAVANESAGATLSPIGTDATACFLSVPFATEPDQLALIAVHAFGASLAKHDDARGVLIVPSSAWGSGNYASYDAVVEHFGEAGEWVPKLDPTRAAEQANAQLQAMMGGGLSAQLGAFQSMLMQNPDAAAAAQSMAQQLSAQGLSPHDISPEELMAGGGGGMQGMLEAAQAMLAKMTPEQQAELEKMAQAAFRQLQGGDDDESE